MRPAALAKRRGLPPGRRLRKRAEFRAVYHRGVRIGSGLFTALVLATGSGRPARLGLTVTRKIGNAVIRNRCKRKLREAVRTRWSLLPDGTDLVLVARKGLERARAEDVEKQVARALRKAARVRAGGHRGRRRA